MEGSRGTRNCCKKVGQQELLNNAEFAVSKMPVLSVHTEDSVEVLSRPGQKRKRLQDSREGPPCKRPLFVAEKGKSPAVVVSTKDVVYYSVNNLLLSLLFQVHVGYQKPVSYVLTPSQKYMGKFIARGSRRSIAIQCLRDVGVKRHIINEISTTIHREIATCTLCLDWTDLILKHQSTEILFVIPVESVWEGSRAPCTNSKRGPSGLLFNKSA